MPLKVTDSRGSPHSGVMQYVVSALVVDNVDPEELGRIKVKFQTLSGEPESDWLRQTSPGGGEGRGLYSLPEVGDEVLVAFLQGDQDKGVIIGQFWNGKDKPPAEAKDKLPGPAKTDTGANWSKDQFTDGSKDLKKNDRRFWRSRSGHLMVFDDTDGAESVQMWDKDHTLGFVLDTKEKRVVLSNTGGDIHIRSKNNVFIEAGQDIKWRAGNNIDGESGQDTTHKAGTNYRTEAGQEASHKTGTDFKVDAGANANIKAQMEATMEGSMSFTGKGGMNATLNGGALAEVKGGMVKLN
ncbi:MAG: phage baseplate assembly protein V [Myxococcota bacterium]